MSGTEEQHNKAHKVRTTGAKQTKKENHRKEKLGIDTQPNRGKNNKAFTGPGAGSHKMQQAQRAIEKKSVHIQMPTEDKQRLGLIAEAPMLVAVVGPPGCGKTTLVRSMAKYYASRNIQRLRGPVTCVAGRSTRITFLEVPNTLNAMCDAAKIADLVIIMVDGAFGFEMETFEFLNIAQVHGFPKIIGVVSHLDKMKTNKQLKKSKRVLRHRFWHEVAEGCKLVCLAPMINGLYRESDVLKLHRLLVTTTPKVQNWKNTHGCVLLDRFEDITDAATIEREGGPEKADRTVAFYGYVRGHAIKPGQALHIPGVGDFDIAHISRQEDPCSGVEHTDKAVGNRLRHLNTKQKKIYAPHCDLGGMVFDDDAVYVYEDADRQNTSRSGEGLQMLRNLQRVKAIDEQMSAGESRRPMNFTNAEGLELDVGPIASGSDDDDDDDDDASDYDEAPAKRGGKSRLDDDLAAFGHLDAAADDDDEEEDGEDGMLAPRHPHGEDTVKVAERQSRFDWSDPVYQQKLKAFFVTGSWTAADKGDGDDEDAGSDAASEAESKGYESISDEAALYDDVQGGSDDDAAVDSDGDSDAPAAKGRASAAGGKKGLAPAGAIVRRGKRTRGAADDDDAMPTLEQDTDGDDDVAAAAAGGVQQSDGEVQGLLDYFISKDLQTDNKAEDFMAEITGGVGGPDGDAAAGGNADDAEERRLVGAHGEGAAEVDDYIKKKMAKKKQFDADYDEGNTKGGPGGAAGKSNTTQYYQHLVDEQEAKKKALADTMASVGEDIDQRVGLVGFFAGLYVRVVLRRVPVEFIRHFDPTQPLFAGALNAGEEQMGFVNGRIKRHRWYPRILKAQDPVVLSIGWRRIQTQPIFAVDDPNGRHRYLKYTPKHMHCICSFYGPTTPTNTGFVVIPTKNARVTNFRLTASGFTTGMDNSATVVKKLKLTGVPERVQKTTTFVKGMFNTDIEAAKFIGAKVKAVSGLRGIIKKVLKGKNGMVRCSFEDKLLMSDIVFMRTWKKVEPPRYCVNVQNLLDPEWVGMRPMAQLRRDLDLPMDFRRESEYREIKQRKVVKDEGPVRVAMSRTMRLSLPFEHKEEYIGLKENTGFTRRVTEASTVAPEQHELKKKHLLEKLSKKDAQLGAHAKELRHGARKQQAAVHKRQQETMDRKIKVAKKASAKKEEFKKQHKTRSSAGKKQ